MKIHQVKCWPEFFKPLIAGTKTFDIRINDRDYKVGDILIQVEYDPKTNRFSKRAYASQITYMADFNQPPGQVVMSLGEVPEDLLPEVQNTISKQMRLLV